MAPPSHRSEYLKENDFPSEIVIDVTTSLGTDVYYISRYNWERFEAGNIPKPFIPAPDRLKDGFDDQALAVDRLADEILRVADESIGDLMRESDLDACKLEVCGRRASSTSSSSRRW